MALNGILPAVVTPIDENGDSHLPACERLATRLYAAGVDCLYVCGPCIPPRRNRTSAEETRLLRQVSHTTLGRIMTIPAAP